MYRPTTRTFRSCAALLLVVQVALLAGGRLHTATADPHVPSAHVEAAGASACAPSHDEARCALCQVTTVRVLVSLAAPPPLPEAGDRQPQTADVAAHVRADVPHPRQPRAPPALPG